MYIIKNAFKSITRSKIRNVLIGIIITVIAVSSCIALSIKNAANDLKQSYLASYNITAQISLDRSALRKNARSSTSGSETFDPKSFMNNVQNLTASDYINYGNSQYVNSYTLALQANMNSSNITKVTSENESTTNNSRLQAFEKANGIGNNGDFKVVGYNSLDAMTEFLNSNYTMKEGTIFDINSSDNPCVISAELAEQNNLTVGSTFILTNPNNTAESYTFTVKGIYQDNSSDSQFSMFSQAANQILTTYNSLNNIVTKSNDNITTKLNEQTSAIYNLKSPDVIDAFTAELKTKGLSQYYIVNTNLESFNQSIAPLNNLSTFATTFLIIVLLIGGSILVILNMLNIRDRKFEIGVLRAIGMKKRSVLAQFVIELLMVTCISILIGTGIGSVTSVPVANHMLQSEISAQQASADKVSQNFGGGQNSGYMMQKSNGMINALGKSSSVNYVDKINAVVNIKILLELALIGVALTIISSSISMIFISRYTPLKILSNRS